MALDNTKNCECGYNTDGSIVKPSSGKKIIYYKLDSPYVGDYTKNCGLVGSEIDSNFFNLKEMDIIRFDWDSSAKEIVLTRVDGEELRVKGLYEEIEKDFNKFDFKYNPTSGILSIVTPTETIDVKGFFTDDKMMMANDATLSGDGCISNPLGISSIAQTGLYRPVKSVVNIPEGKNPEDVLNEIDLVKGDRFITIENISKFGRLYDYYGVQKIAEDLAKNASEWRIPTKTDWDVMLTCVEGCTCKDAKTIWHDSLHSNEDLGRFAGKYLKGKRFWKEYSEKLEPVVNYDSDYTYPINSEDKKGFSVLPLGYGDEHRNPSQGFSKYSAFWTSTPEDDKNDMYTKRFNYDKNTVYQASTEPTERLSLRLVKTYNGKNSNESEVINGMSYPCVTITVPNEIKDSTIYSADANKEVGLYATVWTQVNIGFNNPDYLPKENIKDSDWDGHKDFDIRCFINDWDGERWSKHELKEGESVVISGEYQGVALHEWRVYKDSEGNSFLVDTVSKIKEELEKIFEEIHGNLNEKIESEIDRATKAEEALRNDLNAEIERATAVEDGLRNDLNAEIERAQAADEALRNDLNAEIERATAVEDELRNDLNAEIERAIAEEARLDGRINKEIEDRIANDIKTGDYTFDVKGGVIETNGENIPNVNFIFDFNFSELPAPEDLALLNTVHGITK